MEELLKHFSEDVAKKIYDIKAGDVTYEMLTDGQKKSFIGITKLIDRNFTPKHKQPKPKSDQEGLRNLFGMEKKHAVINGPAGTGKSTMTKFIVEYIKIIGKQNVLLACTPNHNARKVLQSYAGINVVTIHKLLKIRPDHSPEYAERVVFTRSGDDKEDPLKHCRILIVDEASFIDRDLFNLLMDNIPKNCIVLGLGNRDQLKPVSEKKTDSVAIKNELSPIFTDERFYKLELVDIKRSDSMVLNVGEAIRKEKMKLPTKSYVGEDGRGVHVTRNMTDFIQKYFEYVKTPEDLLNNRMVAFSNEHVDQLNMNIRKKLYDTEELFVEGEILVAQAPWQEDCPFTKQPRIIFDNGTFLRVETFEEMKEYITVVEVPEPLQLRSFHITATELDVFFEPEMGDDGKENVVRFKVIHPDDKHLFTKFLSDYANRLNYMKTHVKGSRPNWKAFHEHRCMFLDYKYLPVSTIHKCQGITVDNVFYYVDWVANMPDQDYARRLSYVSITRARDNAFLKL